MSRKPQPPARPGKVEFISVRVTPEQKAIITAAAERETLDTSTWLRQLGMRAAKTTEGSES